MSKKIKISDVLNTTVIVAALGYFVDVYDLVLFLIVGKKSLAEIGISSELVLPNFQYLLNVQMIGMLVGGLFWGILGDKKGRLSVLFGSIIMYSLANIANGFVTTLDQYAVLRFIAGFGLAGELGAGITLVSEIMHKDFRGYGTMIVASVGVTGAVAAALVGRVGWQTAYFIGGGLGISLLLLRIGVFESGFFKNLDKKKVKQGNFFQLFHSSEIAWKYINCILIGLPVWFIIGILIARAPEIAKLLNVQGSIEQGNSIMLCYGGLVFGDLLSGALSQALKSRKKVFLIFYALNIVFIGIYLNLFGATNVLFYLLIFLMGFSVGFWAIFVTVASEQFGTNLRATVTTTVPNFVRGSLVLIAFIFDFLVTKIGVINTAYAVTVGILIISYFSLRGLKETFGRDLDFIEVS